MKVLLIQPPTPKKSVSMDHLYLDEPLALEYLGTDVAPICDVKLLDMRLSKNLFKELTNFKPDIVGVTGYTVHSSIMKDICRQTKQLYPKTITIVGGHHATVAPEDFAHPSIDIIVIGDGVPTLREIIEKVGKREDHKKIEGIAFFNNDELCKSEPRALTDLDDFPLPDRSLTKHYSKHYRGEWMERVAMVRTSRGCPNHCSFCGQWKLTGRRYLKRSVVSIVKELQQIEAKSIYFADDESFIDAKRMSELAKAIKAAGIKKKYKAAIRSDTIVNNLQVLKEWQQIGLDSVLVGLEFYTQDDLDYIAKGTSTSINEQAVELVKNLGIHLYPLFMVRPNYSETNFKALLSYVQQFNFDRRVQFTVLTPLPGTDLYEQLKEQLLGVGPEFFDCVHTVLPTKLPLKVFYSQLTWLYWYSVPMKAKRYLEYLKKLTPASMIVTAWEDYRLLSKVRNLYKDYD